MRRLLLVSVVALVVGASVGAQRGRPNQPEQPAPACPPNGYMPQPYYGMFGQNGGDGASAYEIASPCIGQEVRAVADSIGMGRSTVLGVRNVIAVMFSVDGTWAEPGGMAKLTKTDFHMAYYLPAMRMFLNGTHADGTPLKEIRVFATQYAWNETQEGRGATPAMNTLNDRLPLIKLTPFGALWSLIDAEGHTKVSTVNGKTVLTGISPYDGIEVAMTVEDQDLGVAGHNKGDLLHVPVAVTAKANGHIYGATFADYRGGPSLEPDVWMIFPKRLIWTLDGKPLADLTVTYFRSNPYVVFPIPNVVRPQKASSN
jgi:hypothetical protein